LLVVPSPLNGHKCSLDGPKLPRALRTFSYAGVRSLATLAVLLSSIAMYAVLLCTSAAVTLCTFRGMGIAEDILRGSPCGLYFPEQLGFSKRPP
jgi:hypothetical protein